jgi:hypothetical protein
MPISDARFLAMLQGTEIYCTKRTSRSTCHPLPRTLVRPLHGPGTSVTLSLTRLASRSVGLNIIGQKSIEPDSCWALNSGKPSCGPSRKLFGLLYPVASDDDKVFWKPCCFSFQTLHFIATSSNCGNTLKSRTTKSRFERTGWHRVTDCEMVKRFLDF